jgi:hypothetical protein
MRLQLNDLLGISTPLLQGPTSVGSLDERREKQFYRQIGERNSLIKLEVLCQDQLGTGTTLIETLTALRRKYWSQLTPARTVPTIEWARCARSQFVAALSALEEYRNTQTLMVSSGTTSNLPIVSNGETLLPDTLSGLTLERCIDSFCARQAAASLIETLLYEETRNIAMGHKPLLAKRIHLAASVASGALLVKRVVTYPQKQRHLSHSRRAVTRAISDQPGYSKK